LDLSIESSHYGDYNLSQPQDKVDKLSQQGSRYNRNEAQIRRKSQIYSIKTKNRNYMKTPSREAYTDIRDSKTESKSIPKAKLKLQTIKSIQEMPSLPKIE
jgi:hypothetical protein